MKYTDVTPMYKDFGATVAGLDDSFVCVAANADGQVSLVVGASPSNACASLFDKVSLLSLITELTELLNTMPIVTHEAAKGSH